MLYFVQLLLNASNYFQIMLHSLAINIKHVSRQPQFYVCDLLSGKLASSRPFQNFLLHMLCHWKI